ncbi:MAG TPA: carboxypeptidase regulatory-like domain-containing protein, partial [Pyrinomonadaceae bacterium]|nr:carboxypeptidase regulatory-like domain-containing protein [Pyrinomonadaceae bacterium]
MRTANRSRLSNVNGRDASAGSRPTSARLLASVCAALLFSLAAALPAPAQTSGSATLRVTVQDPQGALIPEANITVTSERTGEQRRATSGGEGTATFSALTPGFYTVRVEGTNFKAFEQRVELSANDTRGVEANLEVGSPTETVTVAAAAAQEIQTETGARENTITARQIENLSIVGRSALELLRTQPGVAAPNPDDPSFQSVGFNSGANANNQYNVNGLRGENNNVSIDGSRVIDIGSNNGTIITANADMVQEVKIQSSNYAAEYGSSGVQLTATTKGGGRDFHGTLYTYARHHKLNANDRSRSLFGIERAKDKYLYPGGNVGGPVLLPFTNFNRDRDRLFFFFGFEVQRQTVDPGAVFAR